VMTEPSLFNAAKAESVEKIWETPAARREATAVLSPPAKELPQVTTEPSLFKAAKAEEFETI